MHSRFFTTAVVSLSFLATPLPQALDVPRPASAVPASEGDLVWHNGTMTLRLSEQPCRFEALARALEVSEGMPQPAQAALVMQPGRGAVPSCWVLDVNGDVVMRDAAGNDGFIPLEWFQRESTGRRS